MKILTNKEVEKIYTELRELKKLSIKNSKGDMKVHSDDLEHINMIAYTIGGTKGLIETSLILSKH